MRWLSTERLQVPVAAPDLRGVRHCIDPLAQGAAGGQSAGSAFQPAFALMWLVGAACAIGAATQAKYHRLAALEPCRWRGARDRHDIRLVFGARPGAHADWS